MGSTEERHASFHTWPTDIKPLPISMSAAGFYHSNKRTDEVTCFSCHTVLEDWERKDDPIYRHIQAIQDRGKTCNWIDKILHQPDRYVAPIRRKAPPLWDHKSIPHKCRLCQKVFSSGNQFRKHEKDAHPAGRSRIGVPRKPLGPTYLGTHRVSKPTRKVVMPRRRNLLRRTETPPQFIL